MILPSRTDPSVIGRWWWTVDRWMLLALLTLSVIGILMVVAASPAVAERLGLESFHFVRRQFRNGSKFRLGNQWIRQRHDHTLWPRCLRQME